MGLFTKSPRVAGMDTPWAVGTPGIGEGVPGYLPPLDVSLPEGVSAPAAAASEPGFFGKGRKLRDILGYGLGAIAQQFGGQNPYQQQMDDDNAMKREMIKARLLASIKQDTDSPYIKDAEAIGLKRGTPEFARWVTRMRSAPRVVTTDQGIYNMDTDNFGLWGQQGGGQSSAPPPEAIRELQSDPSGAAEFDQIFGAGASRRYLGQ